MSPTQNVRLEITDFQPLVGGSFTVAVEEDQAPLTTFTLASSRVLNELSFALYFEGPAQPELPQHIYWLNHPTFGTRPIFLVPISGNAEKRTYEAIFNYT